MTDDVLIRAETFGVGQPDRLIRSGVYKWMPPLPANPGNDVAGRVEAIGKGVSDIDIGQKVLLSARDLPQRGGCYAELIAAPADAIHMLPEQVDLEAAVCLANYQVAWALLNECGSSRPPKSFSSSARPAGSVRPWYSSPSSRDDGDRNRQLAGEGLLCTSMGADHHLYRVEDVVARVRELTGGRGVDLVLDHVGGPVFFTYLSALDKWGTVVSYNAFDGLPTQNLMEEMRKHLDVCPAIRCFSFHIYDHDREGRRAIMKRMIGHSADGTIRPRFSGVSSFPSRRCPRAAGFRKGAGKDHHDTRRL